MPLATIHRTGRLCVQLLLLCLTTTLGVAASGSMEPWLATPQAPTGPPPLPASATLLDLRPLTVTLTIRWHRVSVQTTVDRFMRDPFFSRNMHFGNWDSLRADVREPSLAAMRARHGRVLHGPPVWSEMSVHDWDRVPQPMRMIAFPLMIDYWVGQEEVGRELDLEHEIVTRTISAIVMAESWFEHRAFFENAWGNRDIGLGQCSNRCRRELARMAARGTVDFVFTDEDYFNPWHATRAAVVWFGLELARARGDLNLAIRAYHRGFEAAERGEGDDYLENVLGVRQRYFTGEVSSPTWRAMRAWPHGTALSSLPPAHAVGANQDSTLTMYASE